MLSEQQRNQTFVLTQTKLQRKTDEQQRIINGLEARLEDMQEELFRKRQDRDNIDMIQSELSKEKATTVEQQRIIEKLGERLDDINENIEKYKCCMEERHGIEMKINMQIQKEQKIMSKLEASKNQATTVLVN